MDMPEAIEQACQNGYIAGLQDGKKERIKITRGLLSPGLESFAAVYDKMVAVIICL